MNGNRASLVFSYFDEQGRFGDPAAARSFLAGYEASAERYRRWRPAIRVLDGLFRPRRGNIVFLGRRFGDLIDDLASRHRVTVLVRRFDLAQIVRRSHQDLSFRAYEWQALLHRAYGAGPDREHRLGTCLRRMRSWLAVVRPRALVLGNDSLFLERALVLAGHDMGIPSVTIQHGLFMSTSAPAALDGHCSDLVLVWGEHFRRMFARMGINRPENVDVLGFPRRVEPAPALAPGQERIVCFLGQPWGLYEKDLDEAKRTLVRTMLRAAEAAGLRVVYRPHPAEGRAALREELPGVTLTASTESLPEAIERYGAFVSLTSTALLEAGLSGRVAIQIRDERFPQDDLEELGIAFGVPGTTAALDDLFRALAANEVAARPVSAEVAHVPRSLAGAFVDVLRRHGINLEASPPSP